MSAIHAERDYVIEEDFMKAVRKVADAKKLESMFILLFRKSSLIVLTHYLQLNSTTKRSKFKLYISLKLQTLVNNYSSLYASLKYSK